jgi:phosphopantetheinyl transferase (holo-ACP synthase)
VVDPPTEAVIRAVPDGDDRVKVEIQGFARAVAVLADRYADPPEPDRSPLVDERPAPHTADQLYDLRWMFHGPHYQGVTALDTIGSNGVSGEITALRSPGSLLDAAGQMLGYWLMYSLPEDRTVLPMRIERLDLYGPHPEPGERLRCTVRFTEITGTDARGDVEMLAGDRLWARMERFTDHRFETTEPIFWFMLYSEICTIAEERDDSTWVLTEPWRTAAMRELVMRRYLSGPERAEYEAMTPKAARSWLIGRIVAKDAVRRWLWKRGHGPIWPIEVGLTNDAQGRPLVSAPGRRDLRISLAHRPPYAACAVAEGVDPGVDIEVVEGRSPEFERLVATDTEKDMVATKVAAGDDRDEVLTRLWTVKEAVGKALGTGLQGRPRDLEVVEMEGPWSRIGDHWVRTTREGEFVVSTVTRR